VSRSSKSSTNGRKRLSAASSTGGHKSSYSLPTRRLKAIDLYSGVGGWSLGLTLAGIDVVASYEWWAPANATNGANNRHQTHELDIRSLELERLPANIDIVVGSPPCTQFSFSNRGGKGDMEDGLKDVEKFLEVVAHIRPKSWAMENVPRVAKILQTAFEPGAIFARFRQLDPTILVVDMSGELLRRASNGVAQDFHPDQWEAIQALAEDRSRVLLVLLFEAGTIMLSRDTRVHVAVIVRTARLSGSGNCILL
jgi:hypothetical protein